MLMQVLWFVAGLSALVIGAEVLVRGASRLALSFGISPLVVGLTIVAMGTSAPEMAVSTGAVLDGKVDVALGNVVGSNIFNILFILGASALIAPLVVHVQVIRQEVPIMLGSALLLLAMAWDGKVTAVEAGLLLVLVVGYTVFLIVQSRRESAGNAAEFEAELQAPLANAWDSRWPVQVALIGVGLAMLVLGSDWLVSSAVAFAKAFGVSDLIIGLTIVAVGTSLPEVATSITAALKGERDIAVGNVVGSNTFNILGCVGLSGLASGTMGLTVADSLLAFDIWVMLAATLACLPIFISGREIARWEGGVLLVYYGAYVVYLIMAAQQHDALGSFSATMMSFVLPLTIVALVASLMRGRNSS